MLKDESPERMAAKLRKEVKNRIDATMAKLSPEQRKRVIDALRAV